MSFAKKKFECVMVNGCHMRLEALGTMNFFLSFLKPKKTLEKSLRRGHQLTTQKTPDIKMTNPTKCWLYVFLLWLDFFT